MNLENLTEIMILGALFLGVGALILIMIMTIKNG